MDLEDELFLEDDQDILDVINFGFPRRNYERAEYLDTMDNLSFFRRFRLTKPTVLNILNEIEDYIEHDNDLNNSLTPMNQLLTTLRLYSCGSHQIAISDFMGCHQTTVSRIFRRVTRAICLTKQNHLRMPQNDRERLQISTDFYNIARFPKVLGCVDGTQIRIQSPGGDDAEVFRNRKTYFSINTQVVGDSHLKIQDVVSRWPGSAHDLTIFNSSRIRARFEANEFQDSFLLGDSGYANRRYLLVPLMGAGNQAEQLYNESHIRTRNTVERLFGVWKRRFPILAYGLRYKPEFASSVIVATGILHNIAIENNENVPPPPENIDLDELNYLIELGDIPDPINQGNHHNVFDRRRYLIDHYFAQL